MSRFLVAIRRTALLVVLACWVRSGCAVDRCQVSDVQDVSNPASFDTWHAWYSAPNRVGYYASEAKFTAADAARVPKQVSVYPYSSARRVPRSPVPVFERWVTSERPTAVPWETVLLRGRGPTWLGFTCRRAVERATVPMGFQTVPYAHEQRLVEVSYWAMAVGLAAWPAGRFVWALVAWRRRGRRPAVRAWVAGLGRYFVGLGVCLTWVALLVVLAAWGLTRHHLLAVTAKTEGPGGPNAEASKETMVYAQAGWVYVGVDRVTPRDSSNSVGSRQARRTGVVVTRQPANVPVSIELSSRRAASTPALFTIRGYSFDWGVSDSTGATRGEAGYLTPLWTVALAAAVVPVGTLLPILRARRRRRWVESGCCAACGYDLRATPGRCPECGVVAAGVKADALAGGGPPP